MLVLVTDLQKTMSHDKPLRKPFEEPVVSEPIDALDATRAFGGLLGQSLFTSSGTALDDGDLCASGYDPQGLDGVDYCPS